MAGFSFLRVSVSERLLLEIVDGDNADALEQLVVARGQELLDRDAAGLQRVQEARAQREVDPGSSRSRSPACGPAGERSRSPQPFRKKSPRRLRQPPRAIGPATHTLTPSQRRLPWITNASSSRLMLTWRVVP